MVCESVYHEKTTIEVLDDLTFWQSLYVICMVYTFI